MNQGMRGDRSRAEAWPWSASYGVTIGREGGGGGKACERFPVRSWPRRPAKSKSRAGSRKWASTKRGTGDKNKLGGLGEGGLPRPADRALGGVGKRWLEIASREFGRRDGNRQRFNGGASNVETWETKRCFDRRGETQMAGSPCLGTESGVVVGGQTSWMLVSSACGHEQGASEAQVAGCNPANEVATVAHERLKCRLAGAGITRLPVRGEEEGEGLRYAVPPGRLMRKCLAHGRGGKESNQGGRFATEHDKSDIPMDFSQGTRRKAGSNAAHVNWSGGIGTGSNTCGNSSDSLAICGEGLDGSERITHRDMDGDVP